jgi:kynurenine formamidase
MTPRSVPRGTHNWGRWGAEDEVGAVNLISPEIVRAACGLVRAGTVYSLAEPLDGPIYPGRRAPWHLMSGVYQELPGGWGGSDDILVMHTHTATHMDGLCHIWADGAIYNGFPSLGVTSEGASRCGIDRIRSIVTRGVLIDVAAAKGAEHLEAGYPITESDLETACRAQCVTIRPGDVVLVRTGWSRVRERDREVYDGPNPGLASDTGEWLASHDVVAVGADNNGLEVTGGPEDHPSVHVKLLRDLGVPILEYLNLENLAADEVYEFLFVAAPLRIPGAVGSPLNPLAIA